MTEPTKKLIWRGSSRCRSLRVVVEQHTPIFYVAGDEVPLGVLDQEREDVLVKRGLLDRVETKVQPAQRLTPVAPRVFSAPPARPTPTPIPRPVAPPPQTVKVDVGVMTAEIKAGPDKVIGTPDDLVNIRPKGLHSIADPDAVETKTDEVEKKPKSSPTRKRKTKKKTAKKGEAKK